MCRMGRRKLSFDHHKNTKRRRRPPSLVVRIPLHILPPTELIVCLPLTTFLSAPVPSAQSLLSRLRESGRLPVLLHQCPGKRETSQSGPATYDYLDKGLGVVLFPADGEHEPVELDIAVVQNVLGCCQG